MTIQALKVLRKTKMTSSGTIDTYEKSHRDDVRSPVLTRPVDSPIKEDGGRPVATNTLPISRPQILKGTSYFSG